MSKKNHPSAPLIPPAARVSPGPVARYPLDRGVLEQEPDDSSERTSSRGRALTQPRTRVSMLPGRGLLSDRALSCEAGKVWDFEQCLSPWPSPFSYGE